MFGAAAVASHANSARPLPMTAGFLCAGFLVRLVFYTGPMGTDDVHYFHFAQRLLVGQPFDELNHQGGRLAFLMLVGTPAAWFGHIHYGVVANLLLFSARDVLVTTFVYKRVGQVGAPFAAALLSFNPISTIGASLMVPDGLLSLFAVASSMATYQALGVAHRRVWLWAAVAGILAGLAYSTKDTALLLLPPTIAALLWWRRQDAPLLPVLACLFGFLLIVCLEMLVLWRLSGDPFYRLNTVASVHNAYIEVVSGWLEFLRYCYWNLAAALRPDAASLPVFLVLSLVTLLSLRDRSEKAFFLLSAAFLTFYLICGTSSLTRLIPLPVQDRYFEIIVPYVAIVLGFVVYRLQISGLRIGRLELASFAAAVALTAAPAVALQAGSVNLAALGKNTASAIEQARQRYPHLQVYASRRGRIMLEPFMSTERFHELLPLPDQGSLPMGLLVIQSWGDRRVQQQYPEIDSLPLASAVDLDRRVAAPLLKRLGVTFGGLSPRGQVRIKENVR